MVNGYARESLIAVTGASGHIGNVICRELLERGYRVRAMYHADQRALEGLVVETFRGDILHQPDVAQLLEGCAAVIHCAGIISIHGDPDGHVFRTNTEGARHVRHAAIEKGVQRIVHLSSVHAVTELPHDLPYDEMRPYKSSADSAYDYSKARGEQIMAEALAHAGPEVIILRPSSVVGPFDFKPSLMGKALMDFYHRKIPFLPEGGYHFVDVRDVARAAVNALEYGNNGEAYVVAGTYYDFRQLTQCIARVTQVKMPRRVISQRVMRILLPAVQMYARMTGNLPAFTKESMDVIRDGHPSMDSSKAARELGYSARPLEETLRDFYAWYWKMNKNDSG